MCSRQYGFDAFFDPLDYPPPPSCFGEFSLFTSNALKRRLDIVVQEEEVEREGAEPKQEQWVLALEWGIGLDSRE